MAASLLFAPAALFTAHADSVTYEHDTSGRLKKATYSDGTIADYTYDANGNRTGATVTTPPPDTIAPSAPGTPTFSSVTMTSATASWTPASDNVGVVGYDYQLGSGSWLSLSNVLSVNLSNLSPATSYVFRVRARDAASNTGPTSTNSFTTPDNAPPTVPSGLGGSAPSSTTVNLSWSASSDNVAVTGYKVYRGGIHIGSSATTSYADHTVSGSTSYSYSVSAYDAAGNQSAQSASINVTTPDTIKPSTPSGLSASVASPTQVNLSWSASSDSGGSGLAGYRIYRGGAHLANSSTTSYSDTGASPSTSHSYTVAAYDNAGNLSGHSNTAGATTPAVLQAGVSSTSWSWFYQRGQPVRQSPNVVASAGGGMGGYSYLWQWVSGDTSTTVLNPTSSSTSWSRSVQTWFVNYTSVWRCRVTDSSGAVTYTPNVTVNFRAENYN